VLLVECQLETATLRTHRGHSAFGALLASSRRTPTLQARLCAPLFAAFEVTTGHVIGQPSARHASVDFLRFLDTLIAPYRPTKEIHVILDNLSAHKTAAVEAWRAAHPNVRFHFASSQALRLDARK
jgi:hypothetical protein